MENLDNPKKVFMKIIKITFIVSLIPIISTIIGGDFASLRGFVFGLVLSFLLLRLKLINITRSVSMEEEKASSFLRNRYFLEYSIYFVALVFARYNSSMHFLATAIGLLMVKIVVIGWMIFDRLRNALEKKIQEYKNY